MASQYHNTTVCFSPYPSRTTAASQFGGWRCQLRLPQVEGVGGRGGSPHALHHLDTVLCQWRQAQFCPLLYFESLQMLKSTEGKLRFEQERGREERKEGRVEQTPSSLRSLLGDAVVKKSPATCQCRRCKRWGFDPWVGKIPWRRRWQPTTVFLPGKSPG